MKASNLDFILVTPPYRALQQELFTKENFDELYDHVTAFSLMSYDFSTPQKPGNYLLVHLFCIDSLNINFKVRIVRCIG